MPFNTPLSSDQQEAIDSGGYQARDFLLYVPFNIVFQCRPAADSSASVLTEIAYDSVSSGDFEDVRRDMTVLISYGTSLDDLKRPLWRGRISQLPTDDTLYINESSIALDTDMYISVLETYEPAQRLRSGNLIDGYKPFEKLAPAISGLSSSYFKEPVSGEAQFTFSPVGIPMEDGATIDDGTAWQWEFSGSVTYDTGDATTREIEVTLAAGHYWVTVYCTDSNGVQGRFIFDVFVQDLYGEETIYLGSDGFAIENSWDNGVSASVDYFEPPDALLDRTRCTIVTVESWRDGDAGFPNVSFVGYLRQDDSETRGDATYGTLKQRSYTIAGAAALAGEIKISQLAVNDTASPAAWDDIKLPNAMRVIQHLGTRYAFFFELFAPDFGVVDNTWYGGSIDVESPFLLEACNQAAEEIDAQLIFAADGQITLRRNVSLVTDDTERNDANVIATIPAHRMTVLGHKHVHTDQVAQMVVGFRSYRTADGSSLALRATAPAVAFGEGPDFEEVPARLLPANVSEADAKEEAGKRAANLLAYNDETDEFTVELDGSYRFMQPSQHQWWVLDVAAYLTTNNLELDESTRFLLRSVSHQFNPERATRTVRAVFRREAIGGLAMILVEVIPAVVPTAMPVRPPMPAFQGAFRPPGTLNSTSQTPARKQPYRGAAWMSLPYAPKQRAEAADEIPPLGCRIQNPPVNFRNPSAVMTGFSTAIGDTYTLFIRGSAKISDTGTITDEMTDGIGAHSHEVSATYPFGADSLGGFTGTESGHWSASGGVDGNGCINATLMSGGNAYIAALVIDLGYETTVTNASYWYRWNASPQFSQGYVEFYDAAKNRFAGDTKFIGNYTDYHQDGWTGEITGCRYVVIQIYGSTASGAPVSAGFLDDVSVTFGTPDTRGDAFYQWQVNEDGERTDVEMYPATRGLRINSTPVAVPPEYNPNGEYIVQYTGDGNPIPLRFQDDNYADNENALLRILVCGTNAGT